MEAIGLHPQTTHLEAAARASSFFLASQAFLFPSTGLSRMNVHPASSFHRETRTSHRRPWAVGNSSQSTLTDPISHRRPAQNVVRRTSPPRLPTRRAYHPAGNISVFCYRQGKARRRASSPVSFGCAIVAFSRSSSRHEGSTQVRNFARVAHGLL